jgi:hypothetical protein
LNWSKGYTNIAWELGNEPNSLKNHFKIGLDGLQLGEGFIELDLLKIIRWTNTCISEAMQHLEYLA